MSQPLNKIKEDLRNLCGQLHKVRELPVSRDRDYVVRYLEREIEATMKELDLRYMLVV